MKVILMNDLKPLGTAGAVVDSLVTPRNRWRRSALAPRNATTPGVRAPALMYVGRKAPFFQVSSARSTTLRNGSSPPKSTKC